VVIRRQAPICAPRSVDWCMRMTGPPCREEFGPEWLHRLPPSGSGQLKKWGLVATAMLGLFGIRKSYDVMLVCGYRILGKPAIVVSRILGKPFVLKADSLGEMSGAFFDAGLARFRLLPGNGSPRVTPTLTCFLSGRVDLGYDFQAELRDFVREHDVDDSVTFTGSVENVHEYLRASDCFVFPTEREAFGISIIEAMACGLMVITTVVGGLADIVHAEETAIVVPARDSAALEAAIERALGDSSELHTMKSRSRNQAVENFSEKMVVAKYIELLKNLVENHSEAQTLR